MRDDFSRQVASELADRAGRCCSNPRCRRPTSGPQIGEGSVNIGVAAHITAASPGGPRYDASLSSEERRSPNNGIWLCQTCAKLIDSDPNRYTVETIRRWKQQAEKAAHDDLQRRIPSGEVGLPPLYVQNQFGDHPPLRALADELNAKNFRSIWVPVREAAAKHTLGYIEQYFEGQEVRTEIDGREHVWMVCAPQK